MTTLRSKNILKSVTLSLLLMSLVTSFFDIRSQYNFLNVNLIFELLIFFHFLYVASSIRVSKKRLLVISALSAYVLFSFLIFTQSPNNKYLGQFFIIYKSFYYLTIMQFMIGKKIYDRDELRRFFYIIISVFLIKYPLLHALGVSYLDNGQVRPGVFTESNYEVIFLIFIYYCISIHDDIFRLIPFFAMCVILLLSGSRSGFLAFSIVAVFMHYRRFNQLKFVFLTIAVAFFSLVVIDRFSGSRIAEIDRVIFLTHFLNDIGDFTLLNYLFGTSPITQVSISTATSLSFYHTLFADKNNLEAFSVLYHAYLLRVIYDHGIVGLFVIFSLIFFLVLRCGYEKNVAKAVLGVLIASGLSVSSLNSSFVVFGLILFMTTYKKYTNSSTTP